MKGVGVYNFLSTNPKKNFIYLLKYKNILCLFKTTPLHNVYIPRKKKFFCYRITFYNAKYSDKKESTMVTRYDAQYDVHDLLVKNLSRKEKTQTVKAQEKPKKTKSVKT